MYRPSRRSVLRLGSVALASALVPHLAATRARPIPTAALGLAEPELEALRARWIDSLTGRTMIEAAPGAFADAIARQDAAVDKLLARVSPTGTRYFEGHDWAIGATDIAKSNAMRMNFSGLESLAIAWATPGSKHEASAAVLGTITQGLDHMHTAIYHPQTEWWGNWWSWLIGATKPLSNIMAILHDELEQSAIDAYCAAIDHFLPNRDPRMQIHPTGPKESDGANRVDICQAIIVRSIVQPDPELLGAAVAALSPTWQYVTEGNGFFEDGSFIQHSTIGYTGTYGLVLLGGLAKLFALVSGSSYDITEPSRSNITGVIDGSFAPFMFNGQMMDAVRGRAVSRYAERSIDNGDELIEATLRLAQAADPATAEHWRGLCRQWIEGNSASEITTTTNIVRRALVTDLMSSDVAAAPDATGPRFYPAMDRLVHRAEDGSWAMCIAMCSNRIAWHEGTEAENFEGVKTSQGMTYLYLATDDTHYDDHFWATSDLAAPAGTTVDLTPLDWNPEGQWGEQTPANEWTGGVAFDGTAVAAMHLVAPGGTGLTARKAWFVLPDMVVALGSDVSTQSEAEVRTVVEHRNLGDTTRRLLVDGVPVAEESVFDAPRWAHLDGVGGYLFLDRSPIVAGLAEREGTWRRNNTNAAAGTGEVRRRQYATLAYTHGVGAAAAGAGYAYAMLPGADQAHTASRARRPGVTVLRNDADVQAISPAKWVTAATFWKAATVGDLSIDGSACLIVRKTPGVVRVAISDPTQVQSSIAVQIAETRVARVTGADAARVSLERSGADVHLTIDTTGTAGGAIEFSLHG
ncbi:polysaccharide lyase 8 family protein [Agromyces cerinus]|uniref:Hyaluronate lyase n=1 Tax=Agromyces cerinus subsp. cerinus TaxID=232089 RepID=A0A1N6F096_9MICO|nr:polysaccharide lyase 8 family protein [Agromyces cerinus]SIN88728.1 hyaluronate lyase [Agromyces cerinus subsp. cerinus]